MVDQIMGNGEGQLVNSQERFSAELTTSDVFSLSTMFSTSSKAENGTTEYIESLERIEELKQEGYEEAIAGVVIIQDIEYTFNTWTTPTGMVHQDQQVERGKNTLLLKLLDDNHINYEVIKLGMSQTLYVKYVSE